MKKSSRPLKIIFFGTPDFAVEPLKAVTDAGYEIAAVITNPDKPAGRGRKIRMSDVKKFALERGLPVLQPENLADPDFVNYIKRLEPDVGIVVAFKKIPEVIWRIPPHGIFNIHASLLPDYRGAAPIHHVIINGEKETGITTFFINDRIDTGEIIWQKPVPVEESDTYGTLYEKLKIPAAEAALETLKLIETGKVDPIPQNSSSARHKAPKLTKHNTRINWNDSPLKIHRLVKGLSPRPAARTVYDDGKGEKTMKIFKTSYTEEKHAYAPGEAFIEGKRLKIAVPGGFVFPLEVRPENKRRMSVLDFINGLKSGDKLIFK